jgi:signal transduction histidine kinase
VQNLLVQIQVQIESLRQMNDESILKAGEQITRINDHITRLMVAGMGVALLISAFACFHLGRSILKPIQQLTRAARQIGEGKLEQQVPIRSRDELGQLAQTFNQMAAQLQAYRESTSEQIVRLHSTMKSALASFPDPIFVLNRQGRIELKNPAAEELSTQLGLGDSLPERLQETAAEVLNEGNDFLPHSFKDVVAFRVNGEEKFLLPRVLTMRGESQKSVGIAVVLHDVTRFRLLDDAKSNLVATVSHELKTPLTSVRMVLHLLLEKTLGTLTPRQEEMLETARKDAERLLRILNDLLDLARLDAGTPELRKEPMAPGALMGDLILEFEPLVAQQGLHLRRTVPESLPDVLVDRHRIAHVFRNFISNAIKHSPPGGEIHVQVRQTHNGGVQFSVLDQGPGVPEEYQGRIFDRFFRVPGQQKTGAGLGLSIAREITVAHGGRIGVRSEPGQGSEFFVVLPVAERAGDGEEIMN